METDQDEFARYAEAHWVPLVRLARLMGASADDAEDLVQSVMLRLCRNWAKISKTRNPDGYIYQCILNELRQSWRRRRRRDEAHQATARMPASAVPTETDTSLDLMAALGRLPLEQRAVILLRYLQGHSESEVGTLLEIPLGTVKSRAARGLHRLSELMDEPAEAAPRESRLT